MFFKNLKYLGLVFLCAFTPVNNEKIYTDIIPTIPETEDEGTITYLQDKELFACNMDEKEGPQNYCDKDGKLFNGIITQDFDEGIKVQYIFKNGKPVKEKSFENGKLESIANIKINHILDSPIVYSETFYDKNKKEKSKYKFDNGERQSVLEILCPDGSVEKEIIIRQDITSNDINLIKETSYKKFRANNQFLPLNKFEHLTFKKEYFGTFGLYTGPVEILDCDGKVIEKLSFENGKKID